MLGGDAVVRIGVEETGRVSGYQLHTGTMAPVRHDDLVISLIALSPYPFSAPADRAQRLPRHAARHALTAASAPRAPAARHLGGQRLEPRVPHAAESLQPDVEFLASAVASTA